MNFEQRDIRIKRARKNGLPCYWENVKSYNSMDRLTFIIEKDNNLIKPLYVKNNDSKLLPIKEGDFILKIFFEKEKEVKKTGVTLLRILDISKYENTALTEVILRKASDVENFSINTSAGLFNDITFKTVEKILTEFNLELNIEGTDEK